ncbi:MAG: OsmC family protein [Anaerolineae bacterium]|nr:OsmC family protein [Anaerolineae bacterium]
MEMIIDFPGGARVDAHFAGHTVMTDQPSPTGKGNAPTPFNLFLASIGTYAGIYVLGFCQSRGIPTEGIRIVQQVARDSATGMVGKITLDIQVPPTFPKKYHAALVRSANQCAVKKHLEHPPEFEVLTRAVKSET